MFWLIVGVLVGVFFYWFASQVSIKWYEWILLVLGFILILFAIQNYSASGIAYEPRAATYLLLMFGIPGLILALIGGILPFMRGRKEA